MNQYLNTLISFAEHLGFNSNVAAEHARTYYMKNYEGITGKKALNGEVRTMMLEAVVTVFCQELNVLPADVVKKKRGDGAVCRCREYIVAYLYNYSLPEGAIEKYPTDRNEVAKVLNRDRTSIYHYTDNFISFYKHEPEYKKQYDAIVMVIEAHLRQQPWHTELNKEHFEDLN